MAATQMTNTSLSDHKTSVVVDPSTWAAGNATDGNLFPNGGSTIVGMNNTGGVSHNVVITVSRKVDDITAGTRTFAVAAGVVRYVKLGPVSDYGSNVLVTPANVAVKLAGYAL